MVCFHFSLLSSISQTVLFRFIFFSIFFSEILATINYKSVMRNKNNGMNSFTIIISSSLKLLFDRFSTAPNVRNNLSDSYTGSNISISSN